ncbi:MAG TPA: hypothetical protein VFM23_06865, partial [Gemmatimonadales bacterium]|nr:hypothetical protein [Gemmatimonadales bacterium]
MRGDSGTVTPAGAKPRALLAMLLLHPAYVGERDREALRGHGLVGHVGPAVRRRHPEATARRRASGLLSIHAERRVAIGLSCPHDGPDRAAKPRRGKGLHHQ